MFKKTVKIIILFSIVILKPVMVFSLEQKSAFEILPGEIWQDIFTYLPKDYGANFKNFLDMRHISSGFNGAIIETLRTDKTYTFYWHCPSNTEQLGKGNCYPHLSPKNLFILKKFGAEKLNILVLTNFLNRMANLEKLYLPNLNLNAADLEKLATELPGLPRLEYLSFHGNKLQSHDIDNLIKILAKCPNLRTLNLSNNPALMKDNEPTFCLIKAILHSNMQTVDLEKTTSTKINEQIIAQAKRTYSPESYSRVLNLLSHN